MREQRAAYAKLEEEARAEQTKEEEEAAAKAKQKEERKAEEERLYCELDGVPVGTTDTPPTPEQEQTWAALCERSARLAESLHSSRGKVR